MENNTPTKWYDKTWVVILLCILFFPVGVYALWMNNSIPKGWKVGVTIFFALFAFSLMRNNKTETKTANNSESTDSVAQQQATEKVVEQAPPPNVVQNSVQQDFIKKKSELFYSKILHPINSAQPTLFKSETEQMTKDFLTENNNTLTDWIGTIVSVSLSDEQGYSKGDGNAKIIALIVDGGEVKLDGGDDNYSIAIVQYQSPKKNLKGIYPDNALYQNVLNLKEGQKIKFSAKVLYSEEIGGYGPVGKDYRKFDNQQTGFDVVLTAVEVVP